MLFQKSKELLNIFQPMFLPTYNIYLQSMFWLNGWVFVYELSGCGFESSCSHLYIYSVLEMKHPLYNSFILNKFLALRPEPKRKSKVNWLRWAISLNYHHKNHVTLTCYYIFLFHTCKKLLFSSFDELE